MPVAEQRLSWRTYLKVIAVGTVAAFVGMFAALAAWQAISERREAGRLAEGKKRVEEEQRSPAGRQREAVKQLMYDPASAVFRNERASATKSSFWCGEVNGKNRMGGMVGFLRYGVDLQENAELSVLDAAHLESTSSDETASNEKVRFAAYWNGYCQ
jgi:hypothetical protein